MGWLYIAGSCFPAKRSLQRLRETTRVSRGLLFLRATPTPSRRKSSPGRRRARRARRLRHRARVGERRRSPRRGTSTRAFRFRERPLELDVAKAGIGRAPEEKLVLHERVTIERVPDASFLAAVQRLLELWGAATAVETNAAPKISSAAASKGERIRYLQDVGVAIVGAIQSDKIDRQANSADRGAGTAPVRFAPVKSAAEM